MQKSARPIYISYNQVDVKIIYKKFFVSAHCYYTMTVTVIFDIFPLAYNTSY